ncbi:TrmH family RNA methyltransferase [Rothia sp. CCM 9418]|uniref:TrmH family RNA methyltransferase n=1 Tax=Rothia sp. CCM 9418 TaxID=3402661 RepID=UPI003ADA7359
MGRKKQLSEQDIYERKQRVFSCPNVLPLREMSIRHKEYFHALTDVHLRKLAEPQWGIYIAESSKVIRRSVAVGHPIVAMVMSEKWADGLLDVVLSHPETVCYVGSEEELEGIVGFHLHRGALAAVRRPEPLSINSLVSGAHRIAILEDIVDHTNVGAIFRSAAALSVDAVLVTPRCADPLYRRSIRVSMGTVFQVPWGRLQSWPEDLELLHTLGFRSAAFALSQDSLSLSELSARDDEKLALIFGSEGHGLTSKTLAAAQDTVMIPMAAQVDSLNVAAASAVAFWETRYQK